MALRQARIAQEQAAIQASYDAQTRANTKPSKTVAQKLLDRIGLLGRKS
jgi:hypothetical protein